MNEEKEEDNEWMSPPENVYDDSLVIDEEAIERLQEDGYIYVSTLHGMYCLEMEEFFQAWADGKGGSEPPVWPEEDDYVRRN